MRKAVQIQFHCLKYVRKKKNVKSSDQPQINVLAMSLYFINQEWSQIFFRTEAQRQSSGKRRKRKYSAISTDLSMPFTDFFQSFFAKLTLLTN